MRRLALGTLLLTLSGCADQNEALETASGIYAPPGEVMPRATTAQRESFTRGQRVAERRFAPEDGLGPTFNVTACASCHEKPVLGGAAGRYRDFLLTGSVQPDGSFVSLGKNGVQNQYAVAEPSRVATAEGVSHSATRNPIPFFGVGLLAEIDEAEILRHADPDDRDGDGVRGRPNYDRGYVGRFGVKAQTVSIEKFIRGPLFNHLGITTDPLSDARKAALPVVSSSQGNGETARAVWSLVGGVAHAQVAAPDAPTRDDDDVPDPELSADDLFDLVSFAMLLAPPIPDQPTPETDRGKRTFSELGCASCHVPQLRGPRGGVPAYTDLLLHDMGEAMADGIRMGEAMGNEFRTAPLWGVSAVGPYLHDGRADTLEQAIEAHGGEAGASAKRFAALDARAQSDVLAFLRGLGGRAETSAGLIPAGASLPAQDTYGAPEPQLVAEERARFARGRAVFDRDQALADGLGPTFNGDSCRACHFQAAVGGAGPSDVDAIRQGSVDAAGNVSTPAAGTLLRLHSTAGQRPEPDAAATHFERRETPALFGLGRIARIPDAVILARADPQDRDGDGIAGVAHVLEDGRLGRFGWKAQLPSLRDFSRDALGNELGLTVPGRGPFGITADDDDAPDPEVSQGDLDDLSFFLETLAPPPRTHKSLALEQAGEALFEAVGCARCHVPELSADDGRPVPLYSDLLLHDVAADGYLGIVDGQAGPRMLRTPPLWGLAESAPYMHDAAGSTLEDAIACHAGEGLPSRRAYEALPANERADLLAFLASL
jgi:CxxC motif-containing protein (DUF1111 family)